MTLKVKSKPRAKEKTVSGDSVLEKFKVDETDVILIGITKDDNGKPLFCRYAFPNSYSRRDIAEILEETAKRVRRPSVEEVTEGIGSATK